jgi:hypothetical protein
MLLTQNLRLRGSMAIGADESAHLKWNPDARTCQASTRLLQSEHSQCLTALTVLTKDDWEQQRLQVF